MMKMVIPKIDIQFQSVLNKYILSVPYELWVWIGKKMDWFSKYNKLIETYKILEKSFLHVKKSHPELFEDFDD